MAADHDPSAAYDDLNVRSIALVGGVGAVLVFVAIVAVQVIYFRYNEEEYDAKVLAVPTRQADATLVAQRERIETAGPGADAEKGEKSVPIEQAMTAVLAEYRQHQATEEEPPGAATETQAAEAGAADTETEPAEAAQPASE